MMLFPSLLLLVAVSSALGQFEDLGMFQKCAVQIDALDVDTLKDEPGDKQMEVVCPVILDAFRCVDETFDKELGSSLQEFAELFEEIEDIGNLLRVAVNTKSMLTDFCTEGTQLNIDVKADMQCFESIDEREAADKCKEKGTINEVIADVSNELEEVEFDDFDADRVCQESAFMAACMSAIVHEKCGQRAFNTFNTILKRTTLFQNMLCSKEKLEEMKTKVIDKLDMSEAEKELYKLGLDLKRRRK